MLDPGAFPVGPDLVEALVESESYDAARAVVDVLADLASDQGHPWAWAGAQRGAAMVEIHGEAYTDSAGQALKAAAASYRDLGLAFDEARTLLTLGRAQRRAKKWGAARDVLERTVAAFEAMGPGGPTTPGPSSNGSAPADRPRPVGPPRPNDAWPSSPSRAWPTRRSREPSWSP